MRKILLILMVFAAGCSYGQNFTNPKNLPIWHSSGFSIDSAAHHNPICTGGRIGSRVCRLIICSKGYPTINDVNSSVRLGDYWKYIEFITDPVTEVDINEMRFDDPVIFKIEETGKYAYWKKDKLYFISK